MLAFHVYRLVKAAAMTRLTDSHYTILVILGLLEMASPKLNCHNEKITRSMFAFRVFIN